MDFSRRVGTFLCGRARTPGAEGKLSLDDEVLKFFPEDAPAEPSANLRSMRVRDLLRMATGHQTEPRLWEEEPGAKRDEPWTKKPESEN